MRSDRRPAPFRRADIPLLEQGLGLAILVGLAAIAFSVFHAGRNYPPEKFHPTPSGHPSTENAPGTLREETPPEPPAHPLNALAGLTPMGAPETYTEATLYEKINGRAPAYMEFNFQELHTRAFRVDAAPGQFVDVYLYRMDTPLNAFGIFSMENEGQGSALEGIEDGVRNGTGVFFRQGSVYAQVLGSDESPAVQEVVERAVSALRQGLPRDDRGMEARALLPQTGMIPASVSFTRRNAYGQELLQNVFAARYRFGEAEIPFFAMRAASRDEAREAWNSLRAFYQRFGEVHSDWMVPSPAGRCDLFMATNFGQVAVVAQRGEELFGVVGADDGEAASAFMERLLDEGGYGDE